MRFATLLQLVLERFRKTLLLFGLTCTFRPRARGGRSGRRIDEIFPSSSLAGTHVVVLETEQIHFRHVLHDWCYRLRCRKREQRFLTMQEIERFAWLRLCTRIEIVCPLGCTFQCFVLVFTSFARLSVDLLCFGMSSSKVCIPSWSDLFSDLPCGLVAFFHAHPVLYFVHRCEPCKIRVPIRPWHGFRLAWFCFPFLIFHKCPLHVFALDECFQSDPIHLFRSFKIRREVGFPKLVCFSISCAADVFHLFRQPRVQRGGPHLRHVHAQATMDPAALHADEDAQVHTGPSRSSASAVRAVSGPSTCESLAPRVSPASQTPFETPWFPTPRHAASFLPPRSRRGRGTHRFSSRCSIFSSTFLCFSFCSFVTKCFPCVRITCASDAISHVTRPTDAPWPNPKDLPFERKGLKGTKGKA